jgi:hypothetical protein
MPVRWIAIRFTRDGKATGVWLDIAAADYRAAIDIAKTEFPEPEPDLAAVYYQAFPVHDRYPSPKAPK